MFSAFILMVGCAPETPTLTWRQVASTGFSHARMAADEGLDSPLSHPFHMVVFEPGTFWMGSPEHEVGRDEDEVLTQVTLTRRFALSEVLVTHEQWETYEDFNPSGFLDCGDQCPIDQMSWQEAVQFANALSQETGLESCYDEAGMGPLMPPTECEGFRLPTEAEWEYAARAGETGAYWYGGELLADDYDRCDDLPIYLSNGMSLDTLSHYCNNSGGRREGVPDFIALRPPGPQGLYDLVGNLHEWLHDVYDAYPPGPLTDPWGPDIQSEHAHRSVSWASAPQRTRLAARHVFPTSSRGIITGIRLARTLP